MPDGFQTTSWGLVLATRDREAGRARAALAVLCQAYWQPLYAYARRRGHDTEEARDLTQAYFAQLLERNALERVEPGTGRLRAFLLVGFRNMMADVRSRKRALKRGAGQAPVAIDAAMAERGYPIQLAHRVTPELVFERRWASTVLQRALDRLRVEFVDADRARLFEQLKPFLTGESRTLSYREVAADLEMTVEAVRQSVHRLRQKYRRALRVEIGETLADPEEIDDEIRHLRSVLGS